MTEHAVISKQPSAAQRVGLWLGPILFVVVVLVKIVGEVRTAGLTPLVWFNMLMCALIVLATLLYMHGLHLKRGPPTEPTEAKASRPGFP